MKLTKIGDKEVVICFNIGVLRRSAKILGVKTPELFGMLSSGDMDASIVMLGESIKCTDKNFDVNLLDELSMDQYTKLVELFSEEMTGGLPESNGQAPEEVKKTK